MIILSKFPTHIAYTKNKKAPNKYVKVNNQSIYNGTIGRFSRAVAVENLHAYVKKQFGVTSPLQLQFPLKIEFTIKTVKNHGSIQRRNGKIIWKPPKDGYVPNWDADNLAFLWIKCISDCLTQCKIIPEDTVEFILGACYKIEFVDDLEDREIILNFVK